MDIKKEDLQWAASQGCITPKQAQDLWDLLGSRKNIEPAESQAASTPAARFDLSHIAYYLGALIVIASLGWFVGLGWERFGGGGLLLIALAYAAAFLLIGNSLWKHESLRTPGGLFITLAVCLTPLAVYGFQRYTGLWIDHEPGAYRGFFQWVKGEWFMMEVATLVASLAALYFYCFPFLTAPLFFTLWFMSMDITPLIFGQTEYTWDNRLWMSMWFGLGILILAFFIDRRTEDDYAFWGYFFGMLAFWGGLSLMDSKSEWSRFAYCLINVALLFLAPLLQRNVFLIFGGMGVFAYIASLFYRLFYDSTLFPFILSLIGVIIILLGIFYQKHHRKIEQALFNAMPDGIKSWLPQRR